MPIKHVSAKNRPKRSRNDPPMFDCEHCGKNVPRIWLSNSRGSGSWAYGQRFCSKGCANKSRATKKIWLDKAGYPQVHVEGRGGIAVHRVVMEKKLGRRLNKQETVHHKDGNRLNYDEKNLELWTTRHGKGQRASDVFHLSVNEHVLAAMSMGG